MAESKDVAKGKETLNKLQFGNRMHNANVSTPGQMPCFTQNVVESCLYVAN